MCGAEAAPRPVLLGMEDGGGAAAALGTPAAPTGLSASQRRAELRRRKLLMNSEERINRIMGFHRPAAGKGEPCGGGGGVRAPGRGAGGNVRLRPPPALTAPCSLPVDSSGWIPAAALVPSARSFVAGMLQVKHDLLRSSRDPRIKYICHQKCA